MPSEDYIENAPESDFPDRKPGLLDKEELSNLGTISEDQTLYGPGGSLLPLSVEESEPEGFKEIAEILCNEDLKLPEDTASSQQTAPTAIRVDMEEDPVTGERLPVFRNVPPEQTQVSTYLGALLEIHWRLLISDSDENKNKALNLRRDIAALTEEYGSDPLDNRAE